MSLPFKEEARVRVLVVEDEALLSEQLATALGQA